MRAREKLPVLWLALGDFLRSEGKEEQALEAYAHGRRSDGRLESREGRVCLMRVCWASVARGVLGEEDVRNAVLWLREACACQDSELASEEGVKILRAVMGVYEERGGGEGLELCEELEKCSDVGVREEVAVWKRRFEEKEMSVSMDCSEWGVCWRCVEERGERMEQEDLVVSNTSSRTGEMSMDETEEESATLHVSVSSALESPRKKQRCERRDV